MDALTMKLEELKRLSKRSQKQTVGYDLLSASFSSPNGPVTVQVWDLDIKIGRAFEFCSDAQVAIILFDRNGSGTPESTSGYVKALDGLTAADLPKFVVVAGKSPLPEQEKSELLLDLQGEKNVKVVTSRLDKRDEIEKILRVAVLTVMKSPTPTEKPEKDNEPSTSFKVVVLGDESRLFWNQSK
jgi:GTPase SAR1 family protein